MKETETKIALICIDLQKEYFKKGGLLEVPSGREVLGKAKKLLKAARGKNMPVVHVRHISNALRDDTFQAGSSMVDFMEEVKPERVEPVITKSFPGAFHLTSLDDILRKERVNAVAICGLLSFMCADTSAREAHVRGYKVYFIRDATAAIDVGDVSAEIVHKVTCAVQSWLSSEVIDTDEFIEFCYRKNTA